MFTKHQDLGARPSSQLSWPSLLFPSLIGGMTTSITTASVLYAVGQNVELARLLVGVVPGMTIGVLVNLLLKHAWSWQSQLQILEAYRTECAAERLEREVGVIGKYVMSVINAHKRHKDALHALFRRSVSDRVIPNVSPEEFYKIVQQIVEHTEHWQAIHHGSIRSLMAGFPDREFMEQFYDLFQTATLRVKQRIVILAEAEERDLTNLPLMTSFFDLTSRHVDSYWIKESKVFPLIKKVEALGDCALYDDEILLQYDRHKQTLTFYCYDDEKTQIVRTLFCELQASLQDTGAFRFQKLDRTVIYERTQQVLHTQCNGESHPVLLG